LTDYRLEVGRRRLRGPLVGECLGGFVVCGQRRIIHALVSLCHKFSASPTLIPSVGGCARGAFNETPR
jgi:hypothetical protein